MSGIMCQYLQNELFSPQLPAYPEWHSEIPVDQDYSYECWHRDRVHQSYLITLIAALADLSCEHMIGLSEIWGAEGKNAEMQLRKHLSLQSWELSRAVAR